MGEPGQSQSLLHCLKMLQQHLQIKSKQDLLQTGFMTTARFMLYATYWDIAKNIESIVGPRNMRQMCPGQTSQITNSHITSPIQGQNKGIRSTFWSKQSFFPLHTCNEQLYCNCFVVKKSHFSDQKSPFHYLVTLPITNFD